MTSVVVLLAAFLHQPVRPVALVYAIGRVEYVALVSCENPRWQTDLVVRERRGHTSYGLAMIDDEWHEQYRGDLLRHLYAGWDIYQGTHGTTFAHKVAHYNGGTYPGAYSWRWGRRVDARRRELLRWLWAHEQVAGGRRLP